MTTTINDTEFRLFVQKQLAIAQINTEYQDSLTDTAGMNLFKRAFVHKTADPVTNYQELEFVGDGILKGILSQYITRRYLEGAKAGVEGRTVEGTLSKIRRYLEQSKTLSGFALQLGFWEFVRADEQVLSKDRNKTLEDVFEAFIGAMTEVIDSHVKRGMGYMYAYNYVVYSLNKMPDIDPEDLDDPVTKLNELYRANILKDGAQPLKWQEPVYRNEGVTVPIINNQSELESVANPVKTNAVMFRDSRQIIVFDGKNWVSLNKIPLFPGSVTTFNDLIKYDPETGKPMDTATVWFSFVYGFPNRINKKSSALPAKITIDNVEQLGGKIIGTGFAMNTAQAKKLSASQALDYLKKQGISK